MKSYLENRQQYVSFSNVDSDYRVINIGVPQGSILGPLLFLIYINDIVQSTSYFRPVIYADDTSLGSCVGSFGQNIDSVRDNINKELDNVYIWLSLNKLSLNVNKTKAMIFHTIRKKVTAPQIKICDQIIEFVDSFNYLGVHLDKHLSWNVHLDVLSKKISQISGILNRLKRFLPKSSLLTLYHSLVSSRLNYGILLWGCKASQLDKVQKKIIRIIHCSKYNSHTEPLFKISKLLKVCDINYLKELIFCYKLQNRVLPFFFQGSIFTRLSSLHHYATRRSDRYQLPRIKHSFMKNSIRYRIPHIYNDTCREIIDKITTHSLVGYKKYIKRYLIDKYSMTCLIRDCRICHAR